MPTKITFNLEIGLFDQQSMTAEIFAHGQAQTPVLDFANTHSKIHIHVELPAMIEIRLAGRGESDTQINEQGHILQDKFLHLTSIEIFDTVIDSFKMAEHILRFCPDQLCHALGENFFWNRNGCAYLNIDQADALEWLLKNPKLW